MTYDDPRVQQLMDLLGISEAEARAMLGLPPLPEPDVTPTEMVRLIIQSLNGGVNGDVPNHRITQTWPSETECIYGLHVLENDQPTGVTRRVRVTLEPMEDLVDEPMSMAAAQTVAEDV